MNYLLIKILLCLLIAGFIGLVIGWLLRGWYRNKHLEKHQESILNLNENNDRWSKRIEMEKNKHADTIKHLNQELIEVKKKLLTAEIKNRSSQTIKEQTKIRLKEMESNYTNKIAQLSQELSTSKKKLTIVIKEIKI